jgi:carbonic anhydrase
MTGSFAKARVAGAHSQAHRSPIPAADTCCGGETRTAASDTIRRMVSGFRSFREKYYEQRPERLQSLATDGQRPQVLVIGCSDSRVDPALLTGAEPGELFVVRNVANLVPPYEPDARHHGTSAALQFAVQDLGVTDIVILGHSSCGGIKALVDESLGASQPREFITPWVSLARRHCAEILAERSDDEVEYAACERAAIKGSLANLMTFPFVRDRINANAVRAHGWWLELKKGEMWAHDPEADLFRRIA